LTAARLKPARPIRVIWHTIFESFAYLVAFRIYLAQRKIAGDFLSEQIRWSVVVAALAGAAIGSKVLNWAENPSALLRHWKDPSAWLAGKTVIGAILGGTIAVEWFKRRRGIMRRTGDLFAIPIAIGIAIGRIGCFLGGLADDTYGIATTLPWGINFGDGIRRHPVQLYESIAMFGLAIALGQVKQPRFAEGDRFRLFIFSYCAWRVAVDFLKPGIRFAGLTGLQMACIAAVLWYSRDIIRMSLTRPLESEVTALG
jgi:prolipoprotein diacylglyceryltransferase